MLLLKDLFTERLADVRDVVESNYVQKTQIPTMYTQRVSYSGLTQPGWPAFALNTGPNLCSAANAGTDTKKVIMP